METGVKNNQIMSYIFFLGNHEIFPVGIPTNQAAKIMWPGI